MRHSSTTDPARGRVRALAQAISLVESHDAACAERLLAEIYPHTGRARIIGITGSPGAGKSTLVDALAKSTARRRNASASSPSIPPRPFTGGAILGDRIRMRSSTPTAASSSAPWPPAASSAAWREATHDVVALLDAAGFDVVLVETVGVGQDEVEIVRAAQTNVVVLVPGMGDDIQAIKAGILEIGDVFVVNKADRPGADQTVTEVTMMMSLVEEHGDWIPPIVKTVASKNQGIDRARRRPRTALPHLAASGELDRRNRERVRIRIETQLKERFMDRLIGGTISREEYEGLLEDVLRKKNNPRDAAEGVLGRVRF